MIARPAIDVSTFYGQQEFDGWNYEKITTCGDFGKICGGYGVKGKGSRIKKTFNLPPGTYSVQLDFIKIDSWFVCAVVILWPLCSKLRVVLGWSLQDKTLWIEWELIADRKSQTKNIPSR